jgi:hypothetical protein
MFWSVWSGPPAESGSPSLQDLMFVLGSVPGGGAAQAESWPVPGHGYYQDRTGDKQRL